jgi:predicted nucleic-acid-binding protein
LIRSVDTNVLVRLLIEEDEAHRAIAEAAIFDGGILIATVVQEAVWVWTSRYRLKASDIVPQLLDVLDAPLVRCSDRSAISWALSKFEAGADFADMLHLALSGAADCFTTFDQGIARHADDAVVRVETLGLA